jgi:hypothetical protein
MRIYGCWGEDSFDHAQGDSFWDVPCHDRARGEDKQIAMFLIASIWVYERSGWKNGRLYVDYLGVECCIIGIQIEPICFDQAGCGSNVVFFGGAVGCYFLLRFSARVTIEG